MTWNVYITWHLIIVETHNPSMLHGCHLLIFDSIFNFQFHNGHNDSCLVLNMHLINDGTFVTRNRKEEKWSNFLNSLVWTIQWCLVSNFIHFQSHSFYYTDYVLVIQNQFFIFLIHSISPGVSNTNSIHMFVVVECDMFLFCMFFLSWNFVSDC